MVGQAGFRADRRKLRHHDFNFIVGCRTGSARFRFREVGIDAGMGVLVRIRLLRSCCFLAYFM